MKIACFSDSHGNIYAMEKALRLVENFKPDKQIFMGDAIGYMPGMQCVEKLRQSNIPCLKGNHEDMFLKKNYSPEKDMVYGHAITRAAAQDSDLAFIHEWPEKYTVGDCIFYHGGPRDPVNEYIYPDTDLTLDIAALPATVKICVTAHTHRPFIRKQEGVLFVNTGSIGMPRDDGRYGSFAVIDTDKYAATVYRFDIQDEWARAMNDFGPVHGSVYALSQRISDTAIIGEMIS